MRPADPFDGPLMAEGYASARPRLHDRILRRALSAAHCPPAFGLVLDAGCGAGLSTAALLPYARLAVGADALPSMIRQAAARVRGAQFCVARMEVLPLRDACCGLVTAAGSLNYTDFRAALREAARVLQPGGLLTVYDFAPGRRFRKDNSLEEWFGAFLARYPKPDDGAVPLDPSALRAMTEGLFEPVADSRFSEAEPFDAARYADYMMTETNVAAAVRAGASPASIRQWMEATLPAVFGGQTREVLFDAYFAVFAKPSSSSTRSAP
jgi:ubiquinone/menaquinone biosynthesis C-methylase UbiE